MYKSISVRKRVSIVGAAALFTVFSSSTAQAERKLETGERVWFGMLHGHTTYSDGSGTPREAFAAAKAAGLDFYAVTDHNTHDAEEGAASKGHWSRVDGVMLAAQPDLFNADRPVSITRRWKSPSGPQVEHLTDWSIYAAARRVTDGSFLALPGQEMTSPDANHVNVFGYNSVLPFERGEFKAMYDLFGRLGTNSIVQLNHPYVSTYIAHNAIAPSAEFKDFGLDQYDGSFAKLVAASDKYVHLIEMLNGPAAVPHPFHGNFHYDNAFENDYFFYLSQGFHLSPSAGDDEHWKFWGRKTPARTGIIAPELTEASIFDAIRQNRVFATEDSDLALDLICNGVPMGGNLAIDAQQDIECRLEVADPSDRTGYSVTVFSGPVEPQTVSSLRPLLPVARSVTDLEIHGSAALPKLRVGAEPRFIYVRVRQDDGDRAWSSPVWINHPRR